MTRPRLLHVITLELMLVAKRSPEYCAGNEAKKLHRESSGKSGFKVTTDCKGVEF